MANGPSCPARSSSVSTDTPCQAVSSLDHLVTQWISTVTSWLGRARNSAQLQVFCCPPRPMEKLQRSRAVCGVGPADKTGKSLVMYWPGGTRPALPAGSWRLRRNPREIGLMTAIFPNLNPGDTCDPGQPTGRLNRSPAATCVALARPVTCTGLERSVMVPLPSWPDPLEPQASTLPFDFSASTWKPPAES